MEPNDTEITVCDIIEAQLKHYGANGLYNEERDCKCSISGGLTVDDSSACFGIACMSVWHDICKECDQDTMRNAPDVSLSVEFMLQEWLDVHGYDSILSADRGCGCGDGECGFAVCDEGICPLAIPAYCMSCDVCIDLTYVLQKDEPWNCYYCGHEHEAKGGKVDDENS